MTAPGSYSLGRAVPPANGVTPSAAGPVTVTVTALPVSVSLSLYAGDDFWLDLTVTNPDGGAADLSGMVATSQIRSAAGAADPPMCVFDATISGNVVQLHLPAVESAKLVGPAVWDCEIVGAATTTIAAGKVAVTAQVTV